jgi:hypothetical protein
MNKETWIGLVKLIQPSTVVYTCNLVTCEVEIEGSSLKVGQPGQKFSEILSQKIS